MRGTKRVCQACEVRFYDLSRDPVLCPSCGAQYVSAPPQTAEAGARAAPFTNKTGWQRRGAKRAEPGPDVGPEVAAEDATEESGERLSPVPSEDVMLDEEADEADVSALVDHRVPKPEER
jgi:uncharacterized protein (TIGR02300 family)